MTDKMRSYVNSDGMEITVNEDHLQASVEIKIELQNASPSRRCNWKLHKQMMEESGYGDSDINENYRCLVKSYQKASGLLTPLGKHVDLLAGNKLSAINRILGDIYSEKAENRLILNEINKHKRELTLIKVIAEEFRQSLIDDFTFHVPHYVFHPRLSSSKNKAILVITDWHIGMKIDNVKGNSFNLDIAKKRIDLLKRETLEYCKLFNVNDLSVCFIGDAVEGVYMRSTNQAFDVEVNFSTQIVKVTEYVADLLISLSEYVNVDYEGIGGNHDRIGSKVENVSGDNAMAIINGNIKTFIQLIKSDRLTFIDNEAILNEIVKDINGKKIKLVHGDEESSIDRAMSQHISMDNQFYDCIVRGHLHSFKVHEENGGRMVVQVGCLSGTNLYAKKFKCSTDAGQAIIIVREDGKILPLPINLQIV